MVYSGIMGSISEFVGKTECIFEELDKFLCDILVMNVQVDSSIG